MTKLIFTGGRQSESNLSYFNKEWNNGVSGVIFEYDTKTEQIVEKINYQTPSENRPSKNYSISFKSGSIYEKKLFVTTLTEVLIFSLPDYKLIETISLNIFNDLHHVILYDKSLFIVVTGLDIVIRYSIENKNIEKIYNCFPEVDTWKRFNKKTDYRKVSTTKPHKSHPNHVSIYNNRVYITRYKQQDVLVYSMDGKVLDVIRLDNGIPHDGLIFRNKFTYTTVNGKIIKIDSDNLSKVKVYDLNIHEKKGRSLGWCRGYQELQSYNYVGFSRIRPTKFMENIKWLGNKITDKVKLKMQTRVVKYNNDFTEVKNIINLEEYKMNWIFSILKY